MGSSAFDPVALADTRTVKNKVTHTGLTGDVLTVGDVIRYDPIADQYVLAKANSQANANFIGIIESIDSTSFNIVYSGEISLPDSIVSTIAGFTGSHVFYLSDINAGKLTTTPPTNPGSVIKPVIIVAGTAVDGSGSEVDGIVVNTAGDVILGDSSVDLSEIQPVGSILAFAGLTSDIPVGWDICDGGDLSIATYPDLYAALNDGKLYGFVQGVTLTRVDTGSSGVLTTDNIVGSKFLLTRGSINGSIECTILSGTPNSTGSLVTNANLSVNPIFINGSSAGTHHDTELLTGDQGRIYVGGNALQAIYSVSAPAKTHFKKPDLRAKFIVGDSRGITGLQDSAFNSYTLGTYGGEEEHTLLIQEIPIHTHASTFVTSMAGTIGATHNLQLNSVGSHGHSDIMKRPNITLAGNGTENVYVAGSGSLPLSGAHTHAISGTISVSATGLTPTVTGTISNVGANGAHNNVPQHMVAIWIIKTRKDSSAKILRLGPSGGGAIIAKNTAKRWARATSGAGATVDIAYGQWGVSRLGPGNYRFTHDLLSELGTADQNKYIVEATIVKNGSGATQMFVANPYNLEGLTFGVRVYDIMGSTFSDGFQFLALSVYGGGTAL